ncbi:FIG4 [Blepharisma stoltei]|uniref:Protein RFT1 homolog n=1 Tax=Blepharisma stoltei TaxID=1481888 RepID=A0AAU9J0F4_9CILI|nr:unnamed protein product [Blepharisma stoltei]
MTNLFQAFKAAKTIIILQLLLKIANFTLNVLIARVMEPEVYGAGNIQLMLLNTLILHFSRENFRKAAQRSTTPSYKLMWISTFSSWIFGLIMFFVWSGNSTCIGIIVVSSMIEAFGEPFHILELINLQTKGRLLGEGSGFIIKCIVIIFLARYGLLAFAIGQLAYSITVTVVYIWSCAERPSFNFNQPVEEPVKKAAVAFCGIAVLKFFLSEGEKIVIMALKLPELQQGVFALVSNLGSIVCRLLFLPIEEITHSLFSKNLGKEEALNGIRSVLKVMWIVGLFAGIYGSIYSDLLIRILYDKKWIEADAGSALSAYCWYILVMAINGVSEAIAVAKSTDKELYKRQVWMLGFSLFYLAIAAFFSDFGAIGMIYANIFSMILRILLSFYNLFKYYPYILIQDVFPSLQISISFSFTFFALKVFSHYTYGFIFIAIGGVWFLGHCIFIYHKEKNAWNILKVKSS